MLVAIDQATSEGGLFGSTRTAVLTNGVSLSLRRSTVLGSRNGASADSVGVDITGTFPAGSSLLLADNTQGALPAPKAPVKLAAPTQQKALPQRAATARLAASKPKALAQAEDHWKEF
jgi:hypothetical protein